MDGILVNIDGAGCELFYFGVINEDIVKVRCTYSEKDNTWTVASFYVVPKYRDVVYSNWSLFCKDTNIDAYIVLPGRELRDEWRSPE